MRKITPFLWFDTQAEEAMNFYVSIFNNSKVVSVSRVGEAGPIMSATFELDGQELIALNGGPQFKFTEAVSLFVISRLSLSICAMEQPDMGRAGASA